MRQCDIVFLSLPSGEVVDRLAHADDGLLAHARAGQLIVDLSTSPWTRPAPCPGLRRQAGGLHRRAGGAHAPRPRPARCRSWSAPIPSCSNGRAADRHLRHRDHAMRPGGQRPGGQDPEQHGAVRDRGRAVRGACHRASFRGGSAGAAGDFHARLRRQLRVAQPWRKGYSPGEFPEKAFPVDYARKDLRYALALAEQTGVEALGAHNVDRWFALALAQGHGSRYFPVISRVIDPDSGSTGQPPSPPA